MAFKSLMNQYVTYWKQTGLNDYGYPTFTNPVTVKGRWEDRVSLVDQQQGGQMLTSNSRVWLDVDLDQGDYVYNGKASSSTPLAAARKIIRGVNIPSIDGLRAERQYYLD